MISDDIPESTDRVPDSTTAAASQTARQKKSWIRRYLAIPTVVGLGLIIYMAFWGENSVQKRIAYQQVIDSLSECLRVQQDSLAYYRDLNRRISTDPALMEQVVREQYNMNRPHEDVFVIE
ncbi:MAG: hypothetical protein Q4C34_09450 [Bacteroidales bacterium]|nr:hypothetical protein [Bacteroidales bacterium]